MKKTLFLTISLCMVLLSGCATTPSEDMISVPETLIMTGDFDASGSVMSGENFNVSGVVISGSQETISLANDIVGQTIPKDQDLETYLSEYLAGEDFTGYVIEKSLKNNNVRAVSMRHKEIDTCNDYMSSNCINFVIKDNTIIRSNATNIIMYKQQCEKELAISGSCKGYPGDGLVYRFTKNGVLFTFSGGEGAACGLGQGDWFTYVNFEYRQSFYSVLFQRHKGVSPDSKDYECENKNTKRTKTETLRFYKSNEDWNDETKALPIQANTTEEAFYKYYNLQ